MACLHGPYSSESNALGAVVVVPSRTPSRFGGRILGIGDAVLPEPDDVRVWVRVKRATFCGSPESLNEVLALARKQDDKGRELAIKGCEVLDDDHSRGYGQYAPAS